MPLGYGSFNEYAGRFTGLNGRQIVERLRVAEALEELPKMDAALAGAILHFSAVRELTRVVTPDTEEAWIRAAREKTSREIEEMTAGHEPGDEPGDPGDPQARHHRIVLEVSAETYATFRDAEAQLRRLHEGHLGDDDMAMLMARKVLEGPGDEGTSSYQIQMTMCERCGRASQDGGGVTVPVDAVAAELAECDAQRLRPGEHAVQDIPPAIRRQVVRQHHNRCAVSGCRLSTWTDVHHITLREEGGNHNPERLILLCSSHHRATHRGALIIDGTYSTGFRFLHADGATYGRPANAPMAGMLSDIFQTMRSSGFKESEARRIVNAVRPHVGPQTDLEDAVRLAFRLSREATLQ